MTLIANVTGEAKEDFLDFKTAVQGLSTMFPSISQEEIERVLRANEGIVAKTITDLHNIPMERRCTTLTLASHQTQIACTNARAKRRNMICFIIVVAVTIILLMILVILYLKLWRWLCGARVIQGAPLHPLLKAFFGLVIEWGIMEQNTALDPESRYLRRICYSFNVNFKMLASLAIWLFHRKKQ
ncbi:unnamed protein product [Cylicocyclus nassatus]|uniref:CUE domain-containing protein n=1 Tax=Cylicocyclus nassatus TaxID=53992 RepID=A0AA36M5F2_CYLNA|nr:unnamed protein product [Cylicocyclus nassatus]